MRAIVLSAAICSCVGACAPAAPASAPDGPVARASPAAATRARVSPSRAALGRPDHAILRAVTDHVSDSLADAFPARPPPVVVEAPGRDPVRQPVARMSLPDLAAPADEPPATGGEESVLLTDATAMWLLLGDGAPGR